jgi:hypothetical protein
MRDSRADSFDDGDEDEDARRKLVGEISRLETLNPLPAGSGSAGGSGRRKRSRLSGREGGPCSQLCIGLVNVELLVVGVVLLATGPDEAEIEESEIESAEGPAEVMFAVGLACVGVAALGVAACCCSAADSTLAYAYFVAMLLLTCAAAWAGWFVLGNMALVAQEVQVHASNHWEEWLALLPARAQERINATDPECMETYSDECWSALVALDGVDADPLDLEGDMRFGGGLVAFLLVFPLIGLCLAKRRLATVTILRKTESALAAVSLLCGLGLLTLSGFFSSGTHQLASAIGGWAVEAIAVLGVLLLATSCTLCTAPDTAAAAAADGMIVGGGGGGGRTKRCSGMVLALLSLVLGVSVCACFFAQQAVFDAIVKAISHEELVDLLGDLLAIYCADHYSGGGGGGGGAGGGAVNGTGSDGSWEWESDLLVEEEGDHTPAAGGGGNGTAGWGGVGINNGTSTSGFIWGGGAADGDDECEEMMTTMTAEEGGGGGSGRGMGRGSRMSHAHSAGLRNWDDLAPYVFAWLDTMGRWLVLLLAVTTARAVLLLKCIGRLSRHEHGGGGGGEYAELNSDQAGVM